MENSQVIYARSTSVAEIEEDLADMFLNQNHTQESLKRKSKTISIGLYFSEDLVAVAQFGVPRTEKMRQKYSVELLRLAFRKGVRIAGGASKLISYYKKHYYPADIFTYQDTTGEVTDVYEHCGFTLVGQDKKKQYLVAPGKTIETGSRKEVLGMPYATRYGPDRILGTKLGEILDTETGKRKSNKDIFVEELGWHIEETSGDRVYEWFNPDVTFYVYRITAMDSDKYYIGVSHVKKANATVEDCLDHRYMGSGGQNPNNKFNNWKRKHIKTLSKEILETYPRKMDAYRKERELIGEKYLTDPQCLNSTSGGKDGGLGKNFIRFTTKECEVHGQVSHNGNSCVSCYTKKGRLILPCPVHGDSEFTGDKCRKCSRENAINTQDCPIHGMVPHQGNSCYKCIFDKRDSKKICEIHGMTYFRGEKCAKCHSTKGELRECFIHGVVTHQGNSCRKCVYEDMSSKRECSIHGMSKHIGGSCLQCTAQENFQERECPTHGVSTFHGNTCVKCSGEKAVSLKVCPVHGESKHRGDRCYKCINSRSVSLRNCEIHGEVKHQGQKCASCSAEKVAHVKFHGERRQGEDCRFCQE